MKTRITFLAFVTIILAVTMNLAVGPSQLPVYAGSGRNIDVFTQKTPIDGRGPDQPSDSFQPQEEVILYALVTYNEVPVARKNVGFQIIGPPNSIQNINITDSSMSNDNGMAEFSFRVPWPNENGEEIVFGEWHVVAAVSIADVIVSDSLTFQAGWILRIKNIATLNGQLMSQTNFLRQTTIVFDLTVENIALTPKTATITVDAQDIEGYSIIHVELYDLIFQPGESNIQASSQIPANAKIGKAEVSATAYTALPANGGAPYSPAAHAAFNIITRNIAIVSLYPSKALAQVGETITITATVENQGNETENFDISAYHNQTLVEKKHVAALLPLTQSQVVFSWNTLGAAEGEYVISAVADPVEGEIELSDNTFIDGIVRLYVPLPQIVHDVAVIFVSAEPLEVEVGRFVQMVVRVKNIGTVTESFNATISYNNLPMTSILVESLSTGSEQNLTFTWDTSGMAEGNYTIRAYIPPLPNEQNTANNQYTDGTVHIKVPPPPAKKHDVAVTAVNPSKHEAYKGDTIEIAVTVANLGDFTENSNVTVYANALEIASTNFVVLDAGSSIALTFIWSTSSFAEGNYTIRAKVATVPGETTIENNILTDGAIMLLAPPVHIVHDITVVSVQPYNHSVFTLEQVIVAVKVKNNGNATESFNVTLFRDMFPIQKITVYSLSPNSERTIMFYWDTGSEAGTYTISAYAEPVSGETNLADNRLNDGTVTVKEPPPLVSRDIAIVWVSADPIEVEAGKDVTIEITVLNNGNMQESFNVTAYYGSNTIQTVTVMSLSPYLPRTLTLEWDTSNTLPGVYAISADATVLEGETNVENNSLTDGKVTILAIPALPYWALLIPFLVVLAIIILLLIIYYWKRRKERAVTMSNYVILVHPRI